MHRWDGLLDGYLALYGSRGLSPQTVERVAVELDRFGAWVKRRRPRPKLEEVDGPLVVRYLEGRAAFRSKATLSGVMSVLRGMGEYLVTEGVWSSNPLRWMRGPKLNGQVKLPCRIRGPQMQRLWEAAATHRQGYHRYLWLAAMGLLYGTGMRRGELVRLDVSDWNREQGLVLIDGRKSGRERRAPVPALTHRCLEAYLPHRHNRLERLGVTGESALLVNRDGSRVKPTAVTRAIQGLAEKAGIEGMTLHRFRHTCASDLLASGAGVQEVQRVLGHERIDTTMRYLHVADPERHEAAGRHPINAMLTKGGV